MFESGSNLIELHMQKVEFLDPIQNSAELIVFRISGLQSFHQILLWMRVWDRHLIKHIKPSIYFDVGGVYC